MWSRLGTKVTVIEFNDKILGDTDKQMANTMQRLLEKQGLSFHLNSRAKEVTVKGKSATVTFEKDGKQQSLKAEKVLVAVGRRAYSEKLNLAAARIAAERNVKSLSDKIGKQAVQMSMLSGMSPTDQCLPIKHQTKV